MIGILFTVLLIALVLGYIMFRLSNTPTISDLNKVIDDVNALGDTVTDRLLTNSEKVEANKVSNETLQGLYDGLLAKSNSNVTDIALNSSSNNTLLGHMTTNTSNIRILTEDLTDNYVLTTALDGHMNDHVFANGLALSETAKIAFEDGQLKFCSGGEDSQTCSGVSLQQASAS